MSGPRAIRVVLLRLWCGVVGHSDFLSVRDDRLRCRRCGHTVDL